MMMNFNLRMSEHTKHKLERLAEINKTSQDTIISILINKQSLDEILRVWVEKDYEYGEHQKLVCPVCNCESIVQVGRFYEFCPNCGKKLSVLKGLLNWEGIDIE